MLRKYFLIVLLSLTSGSVFAGNDSQPNGCLVGRKVHAPLNGRKCTKVKNAFVVELCGAEICKVDPKRIDERNRNPCSGDSPATPIAEGFPFHFDSVADGLIKNTNIFKVENILEPSDVNLKLKELGSSKPVTFSIASSKGDVIHYVESAQQFEFSGYFFVLNNQNKTVGAFEYSSKPFRVRPAKLEEALEVVAPLCPE